MWSKKSIALVFLFAILTTITLTTLAYALFTRWTIHNSGNVIANLNLEVTDTQGQPLTTIKWGNITRNTLVFYQANVKNIGTVPLTLTMTDTLPPTDGSLTWNAEGTVLTFGVQIPVTFTLNITLSGGTPFSFDTVIDGTW